MTPMDAWINGAERIIGVKSGAPYRVANAPWRFVFHTMEAPEDDPATSTDEGWSLQQTKDYIAGHQWPPHLWALYKHDWVGQTVALDLAAYALVHDWSGSPETNHQHAIQVEVMGYAKDGLTGAMCDWLGRRVLRPVIDAGVPIDLNNLALTAGDSAQGTDGSVRMSTATWEAFDGICGHQNVPRNSHWDPGVSDYVRIARAAGAPTPEPPIPEEQEMLIVTHGGASLLVLGGEGTFGMTGTDRDAYREAGVPEAVVSADGWSRFQRLPRLDVVSD